MPPATRVEALGPGPSSEAVACALADAPDCVWLEEGLLAAWPDRSLTSRPKDPDPLPALSALLEDSPPRHLILAAGYDLGARMDRLKAKDDLGEPELEARRYPACCSIAGLSLSVLSAARRPPPAREPPGPRRVSGRSPLPFLEPDGRNFSEAGFSPSERPSAHRGRRSPVTWPSGSGPDLRGPLDIHRRLRRISPAPAAFLIGRASEPSSAGTLPERKGPRPTVPSRTRPRADPVSERLVRTRNAREDRVPP